MANLLKVPRNRDGLNDTFDAELLCDNHGSLLPDDESGPVRVRAHISRRDGHVSNFEPTHTVHVQLRIHDPALFARLHCAGAELMHDRPHKMHGVNYRRSEICRGSRSPSATTYELHSVKEKGDVEVSRETEKLLTLSTHELFDRTLVLLRIHDARCIEWNGSLSERDDGRGLARSERGV